MNSNLTLIPLEAIQPYLRFARIVEVDEDYPYNDIVCYDARVIYILGGAGMIRIDGHLYRLSEGCLAAWQAGQRYGFEDVRTPLQMIMLNLDYCSTQPMTEKLIPDKPEQFCADRLRGVCAMTESADRQGVLYLPTAFWAEPLMRLLLEENEMRRIYADTACRGILIHLLTRLVRSVRTAAVRESSAGEELIAYINAHLGEHMTSVSLGQRFNYHPNHVSRLVRSVTGLPLHRYLVGMRIKLAWRLLCDEGMSVTETAKKCGFSDAMSFSKCFKKHTGMTPTEAMQSNRG